MLIGSTAVQKKEDLKDIPTRILVDVYNNSTGKKIKKFSSRETAIKQVWGLIENKPSKTPFEATKKKPRFNFNFKPAEEIKPHRPNSKRAKVIELLTKGATFEEVSKATGWDQKQTYEGIRLIHIALGYGMKVDSNTAKISIYK